MESTLIIKSWSSIALSKTLNELKRRLAGKRSRDWMGTGRVAASGNEAFCRQSGVPGPQKRGKSKALVEKSFKKGAPIGGEGLGGPNGRVGRER